MKKWQLIVAGFLAAAVLWLGVRLRGLISLLLWSAVLAYFLLPLMRWWERFLKKSAAAAASILTVLLTGTALAALVIPALMQQLKALTAQLPAMTSWFFERLEHMEKLLEARLGFRLGLRSAWMEEEMSEMIWSWIRNMPLPSSAEVGHGFLIPWISGSLLGERENLLRKVQYLIPSRLRGEVLQVMERVHGGLTGYLRGQLWIALFVGILTGLGLYLVRIPYALVLGMVMMLCNVIPYFGPLLGAVPIAVVAAAEGAGSFVMALAVVFIVQQLENMLISPRVMGSSLRMKPLPVMISVLAGGILAGTAGMFLALPVVIALREWIGYFMDR